MVEVVVLFDWPIPLLIDYTLNKKLNLSKQALISFLIG